MSGYIFHCTPCGAPHAGECPPKKSDVVTMWREAVSKDVGDWQKPVFTGTAPMIGSCWRAETRASASHPWHDTKIYIFEVQSVIGNQVSLIAIDANTGFRTGAPVHQKFHINHWQINGYLNSHNIQLRFVV